MREVRVILATLDIAGVVDQNACSLGWSACAVISLVAGLGMNIISIISTH